MRLARGGGAGGRQASQPGGESAASEALFAAGRLLAMERPVLGKQRRGTVVLVTDGGIREPSAAVAAAKRLQAWPWPEGGVKVMVVLVQEIQTARRRTARPRSCAASRASPARTTCCG
ncbi:unnamed protein product [Prorocentrum cordatum]|uniref:VWFA domain-containing protein n=1 Tax=Prorocentrum cordatum TaxID=2364126 RepID=A0ABN9XZD5_9DINO|nr:unnamed protein product [Polarella glacialis]